MSLWAKLVLGIFVLAAGLAAGVWLHTELSKIGKITATKTPAWHHRSLPRVIAPIKTDAPKLPPASAGTNHPVHRVRHSGDPAAAQASFAALEASLGAPVGLAAAPLGSSQPESFGQLQVGHAWSSMKVPIIVTLMRNGEFSGEDEGLAHAAITASDNEAAAALFSQLESSHGGLGGASAAVQETLAASGDTSTQIATAPPPPGAVSTWGQTEWSPAGSVIFYQALACDELLDAGSSELIMGMMEEVIPEQQWGLGEAGFPAGTRVAFKAGWGPEADSGGAYLVRQAGIIRRGSQGTVVTMMAEDPSGSFEAGIQDIDQIATWVAQHLHSLGYGRC